MPADQVPELDDRDLHAIVRLVYDKSGITLNDGKRALITARLNKRVRTGGFGSFRAYLSFVEHDRSGEELVTLLDAIATNHTSFFREEQHFAYLRDTIVPDWRARQRPALEIWSAACSTGEEPYTIAMTLADVLSEAERARVRILASDLSTKALARARAGVYVADRVKGLPIGVLRQHFEKGLGASAGTVRVRSALRQPVEFQQLNLLEIDDLGRRFDVIFCRNVMIYFDKAVQQRVVSMLERHLLPGGHLFISHSESVTGLSHHLTWVAPAAYRGGRA